VERVTRASGSYGALNLAMLAFLVRLSPWLAAAAEVLCRRGVVIPLLLVTVVAFSGVIPYLFVICLDALCLISILWCVNRILSRFLTTGAL